MKDLGTTPPAISAEVSEKDEALSLLDRIIIDPSVGLSQDDQGRPRARAGASGRRALG